MKIKFEVEGPDPGKHSDRKFNFSLGKEKTISHGLSTAPAMPPAEMQSYAAEPAWSSANISTGGRLLIALLLIGAIGLLTAAALMST